jgi:EasF-like predicted methyltransferase
LDLSLKELQRTLSEVPEGSFKYVQCFGLHGTYDDGLEWLKSGDRATSRKTVLTLGSSIGNFKRHEASGFLGSFAAVLMEGDSILVGVDACQDGKKVFHAYNDVEGITHTFIKNGLSHANKLLGYEAFNPHEWNVIGEYDSAAGRHHAFVAPIKDVTIDDVRILAGERIRIEESYKYSVLDTSRLWGASGLLEGAKWSNKLGDYGMYLSLREFPPPTDFQDLETITSHINITIFQPLRIKS